MIARKDAPESDAVPAPARGDAHEACANCGAPGVASTDGVSANRVSFCERHAPAGLT